MSIPLGAASGINLQSVPGQLFAAMGTIRAISSETRSLKQSSAVSLAVNGPWTPPQYSEPALTVLTVPSQTSTTSGLPSTTLTVYVFDAVFRLNHSRTYRKTQHPVLTGAAISDHIYAEPARVTLEIGMSDAMSSFTSGVWVGASTKSISAWQILKQLGSAKTLFTLTTRLDTYYNMAIVSAISPDDNKTKHALRASLVLEEIIAGSVSSTVASSAVPQVSDNTPNGVVQPSAPSAQQLQQNAIPSTLWPGTVLYPNVPGAGNVSSNSLSQSQ